MISNAGLLKMYEAVIAADLKFFPARAFHKCPGSGKTAMANCYPIKINGLLQVFSHDRFFYIRVF